jgi:hypothetical protein
MKGNGCDIIYGTVAHYPSICLELRKTTENSVKLAGLSRIRGTSANH